MRLHLLALLPTLAAAAPEAEINAATLYAPALAAVSNWVRAYPGITTNPSSPDAARAYADLKPILSASAVAASATYCDWGTRYEDGFAATLPYLRPVRDLNRALNWAAGYALSNGSPAFVDHALESLRAARNAGEDTLVLSLLVQAAGEMPALDLLTRHADRLSPDQAAQLATQLANLPPGGDLLETARLEKAMAVDQVVRDLLRAMREVETNQVADAAAATRSAASGTNGWLTTHLRLASVVDSAGRLTIGFETRDGQSILISPGRPSQGIELLSADVDRGEAVISRSNETALVKLTAREITPLRLRLPAAATGPAAPAPEVSAATRALLETLGSDTHLRELRDGQEALTLLTQTSRDYDEWIAAMSRLTVPEFQAWEKDFLPRASPLTKLILPAMGKVMEKERAMLDARARLDAALATRRGSRAPSGM